MNTHYAVMFGGDGTKAVAALGFPSFALAEAVCTGIALVNDDVHFGLTFEVATSKLSMSREDWRTLYESDEQAIADADYEEATRSAHALVTADVVVATRRDGGQ